MQVGADALPICGRDRGASRPGSGQHRRPRAALSERRCLDAGHGHRHGTLPRQCFWYAPVSVESGVTRRTQLTCRCLKRLERSSSPAQTLCHSHSCSAEQNYRPELCHTTFPCALHLQSDNAHQDFRNRLRRWLSHAHYIIAPSLAGLLKVADDLSAGVLLPPPPGTSVVPPLQARAWARQPAEVWPARIASPCLYVCYADGH